MIRLVKKRKDQEIPAPPQNYSPASPASAQNFVPGPQAAPPIPEPDYDGELCALIESTLCPPKKEEDDTEWLDTLLTQKNISL